MVGMAQSFCIRASNSAACKTRGCHWRHDIHHLHVMLSCCVRPPLCCHCVVVGVQPCPKGSPQTVGLYGGRPRASEHRDNL